MNCVNLLRSGAAAGALVLGLGACGGDDEPAAVTTVPGGTGATTNKIEVKDFRFNPEETTVKRGATVTWTFGDDVDHSVEPVGGTEPTASSDLQGGKTYTYTFEQPGTYGYRCGIHNSMTGTVVVIA